MKIGDRVKIVKYGWVLFSQRDFAFKKIGPGVYDMRPEMLGKTGIIDEENNLSTDPRFGIAFDDGTHVAWFNEEQLELIPSKFPSEDPGEERKPVEVMLTKVELEKNEYVISLSKNVDKILDDIDNKREIDMYIRLQNPHRSEETMGDFRFLQWLVSVLGKPFRKKDATDESNS